MAQLPTFSETETAVAVSGDWHGNTRWAVSVVEELGRVGIRTILHLGDFGIWPGPEGDEYVGKLRRALEENDQTIYVTLGNHEDYTQVHELPVADDGLKWIRPNIAIFPRPFRFELGLHTVLSLGGAPSVDREFRKPYKSWWPEEMITEEMANEAVEGGHANIMLAHDAPNGGTQAVERILSSGGGWSKESLAYAAKGRKLMDHVVYNVKPDAYFHGHYHVKDSGYLRYGDSSRGEIHALNCDGMNGNVGLIHLDEDFIFDWINH